jgi:hypothetical protein
MAPTSAITFERGFQYGSKFASKSRSDLILK